MLARQSAAPMIRLGSAVAPDSEMRSQQSRDDNNKDRDVRSQSVTECQQGSRIVCCARSIAMISRVRKNAFGRAPVLVVSQIQVMLFRGRTKKFNPNCVIPQFDHNESHAQ